MKYKLVNENYRSNYIPNLMRARGIENFEDFLDYDGSKGWSWLDNLHEGAACIADIVVSGKKILLIVDCDCDGFTSSAIIYQYLLKIGFDPDMITYLVHDGKQHGLEDHVEEILDSGEQYGLVIVPDAGSNDGVYCEQLKDCCEKFLILDHHIIENPPANNMIVINNQSSPYKNKDLTGAGVVYRFCQALDDELKLNFAREFIDLAALGICGDMGSMLSAENQWFMREGFAHICNYMFQVLVDKQSFSMNNEVTPMTVAFYIVPLINAMIRVGTHEEKVRLFEAFINGHKMVPCNKRGAKGTMEECAVESARECTNAKSKQGKIKDAAIDRILTKIYKEDLLENKILFVRLDDDDQFPAELNGSTILAR